MQACIAFEKAIKLNPEDGSYQLQYANNLRLQGKYKEAIISYEKGMSLVNEGKSIGTIHYEDLLLYALCHHHNGNKDKAIRLITDLISVYPSRKEASESLREIIDEDNP
jgi:tetratricopeptide (TPR) repeat protein